MSAVYNQGAKVQNCKVISHGDILSQQCDWKGASMQTSCRTFFLRVKRRRRVSFSFQPRRLFALSLSDFHNKLIVVRSGNPPQQTRTLSLLGSQQIVSCMSRGLLCLKGVFPGAGVATVKPRSKSSAATHPLVIQANTPTDSTRTPKQVGRGVSMHIFCVCSLLHMA